MTISTTAREFGRRYAQWRHLAGEANPGSVDIDKICGGSRDIPEGDYSEMRRLMVTPNAREYWRGYNEYWDKAR